MKKHLPPIAAALLAMTVTASVFSQPPPVVSPEVRDDRTVTFRLRAPDAATVVVRCEGLAGPAPLVKDDAGLWTLTTAPLAPDIYSYTFLVDGVRMTDPANPLLKYNLLASASEVHVPGAPGDALPWERHDPAVPRGVLHRHSFRSDVSGDELDFVVYTPPGYEPATGAALPVLYLLHGYSDDAGSWTATGRAHIILDNLIAQKRARPMLVVMPLGYGTLKVVTAGWARMREGGLWERNVRAFRDILTREVLPRVESAYRVSPRRGHRAIAGLSMGGAESLDIGLSHPELFGWIGAFSSGGLSEDFDTAWPRLGDAAAPRPALLWIACGEEDFLLENNRRLSAWLAKKDVKHTFTVGPLGHTFRVWRPNLAAFIPLLFSE